ncbi:MAG TPA: type IV toxin-antitoxin system AbiEi family antitoxin domain-containing protein [Actinoplanes sp.]|nr:type IV toxin-antitoxin system AbiEi family antitoxin domain-containing protein [Actinoplanes sp.]
MDEGIERVARRQDGLVSLDQARRAGLTVDEVHRLCRRGRWRRLARTVYLVQPDAPEGVLRRARIRAAVASLGPHAIAVLDTAAELHHLAGLRPTEQIHVSLPGRYARPLRRREPDLVVHQLVLPRAQTGWIDGIPVSSPLRTVADNLLRINRYAGVSLLDSALNLGVLAEDDLVALPALLHGRRGAVAARTWLREADGRAQSPLETRVRLRCVDGGVRPDHLQHEIRGSGGGLLGIADFAWTRARVLGEADGRGPHGSVAAVYADRKRQNRLTNAGWRILRFTWADTLAADYIPGTVRQALHSAR